jgi:hypothetical protein
VVNALVPRAPLPPRRQTNLWTAPAALAGLVGRDELQSVLTMMGIARMQAREGEKPAFSLSFGQGSLLIELKTDASSGEATLSFAQRDVEDEESIEAARTKIWIDFGDFDRATSAVGGQNLLLEILTKKEKEAPVPHILRMSRTEGDYECQAMMLLQRRRQ